MPPLGLGSGWGFLRVRGFGFYIGLCGYHARAAHICGREVAQCGSVWE